MASQEGGRSQGPEGQAELVEWGTRPSRGRPGTTGGESDWSLKAGRRRASGSGESARAAPGLRGPFPSPEVSRLEREAAEHGP